MTPEPPSVVVLGASGFLGRHVRAAFSAAGARVTPVSRGARDGVALDLVRAGHRDLVRLCAGARVVVNAAGAVWGGTEQDMTALNADLATRVASAVADLGGGGPRLVHLGSAYEYGPVPAGTTIGEDRPPAPPTPYGRTKLLGTRAVVRAAENGVDAVVLRVSVACGPGTPSVSLPGIVARHLAAGREELRLAPLLAHRDFVDVRDVADAVVAAVRAPRTAAGAVVNVGSGRAVPVRRLVDLMISLSGRELRVVEESPPDGVRSDAPWQRLDITRARSLLGWEPRRPLETSLRDLLAAGPPGGRRLAVPVAGAATNSEGQGEDRP
jgi:NDP-hexose 4-ketoreductase